MKDSFQISFEASNGELLRHYLNFDWQAIYNHVNYKESQYSLCAAGLKKSAKDTLVNKSVSFVYLHKAKDSCLIFYAAAVGQSLPR